MWPNGWWTQNWWTQNWWTRPTTTAPTPPTPEVPCVVFGKGFVELADDSDLFGRPYLEVAKQCAP